MKQYQWIQFFVYIVMAYLLLNVGIPYFFGTNSTKESFQPISTCAKDPYKEGCKVYYKTVDETMCAQGDRCQVQRDNKNRVEFALCVTKPIFTGA